ncbi:hypothetical protein [Streptosporangium longisporum]|uniref:Uncharacterized protein n=1 Tax=Streptosporangium longisporum TaxID=46187 RepID=A0ABP6LBM6_9ACTN
MSDIPALHDRTLSSASLARLGVSVEACDASDIARVLVDTTNAHAYPGEVVEQAALLVNQAREVLRLAVVHERLKGTSWERIGRALGDISKQAASERYVAAERDFRRRLALAWLDPDLRDEYLGHGISGSIDDLTVWAQERRPEREVAPAEPLGAALPARTAAEEDDLLEEAADLMANPELLEGAELDIPNLRIAYLEKALAYRSAAKTGGPTR